MAARVLGVIALLGIAVVIVLATTAGPGGPVAVSPTPTVSATPSAAASPTPGSSPTSTASPSKTPSPGRFVNAAVGYSIELTPAWRRSGCFGSTTGAGADAAAHDYFLTVSAYEEQAGHTGIPHDLVEVHAQPNPERLTARQWWDAGRALHPAQSGTRVNDTTFQGRPALQIVESGPGGNGILVPSGTHMFEIRSIDAFAEETTAQQRDALIASIRFLTGDELAAARAAPTPSPPPARSPNEVANALRDGFARKDVAVLASVAHEHCMQQAVVPGGGSAESTQRYFDRLRDQFARGLSVTVGSAVTDAPGLDNPHKVVAGVWKEPGQPDIEVDFLLQPGPNDRWSWVTVLYYTTGRP